MPEEAGRRRLAEWAQAAFGGRDGVRPLGAETLHLTLAFLGSTPAARADEVGRLVGEAVAGRTPARLTPGRVKGLRRLFAVDLTDTGGHATALAEAVDAPLAAAGLYEPEDRAFWPHVTVARVGRGKAPGPTPPPPAAEPFRATEVVLFRSVLGRGPAQYEALDRHRLAEPS